VLDTLSIYIPMDRRQALARGSALPDQTQGAALFADISGFTPLTEALAESLGPQRGAEELTRQLNLVYEALIAEVDRYRGSVIGFSGDAITCWFDGDDGLRATTCALAMQTAMGQLAAVTTPSGVTVTLAMKASVATGPVRRFVVGDPEVQVIDVLAGSTLVHLAATDHQASKGDVVLDPAAAASLGARLQVREWRVEPDTALRYPVVRGLTQLAAPAPWPALAHGALPEEHARRWLLRPIYERVHSGQGEFLSELRPAASVFVRFAGIDFDGDPAAGSKLDAYIRWVQQVVARYEGSLIQVTIGDKGSYFYAAFGAPLAHDDDPDRAVATALELQAPPAALAYIHSVQIGISAGRMRTGAYGGVTRRTYGVLGDEVNLAARLMVHAAPGTILVSPRIVDVVGRRYDLQDLGLISVKGKQAPIAVARVLGRSLPSSQRAATMFAHPLVGREPELAAIDAVLAAAQDGSGQILRVEGVAGVGKSHLAAAVVARAQGRGLRVALGASQSTTQGTAYTPWRQVFRTLLVLPEDSRSNDDPAVGFARQIAALEASVGDTHPDWVPRLPLLSDLLGLPIPDNATTTGLDPELRQGALFALIGEMIHTWAQAQPLLLLIEDAHWMDEASLDLARTLGRTIARYPIVLALFHRPPLRAGQALFPDLERLAYHHPILLDELGPDGVAALIANRLGGPPAPLARGLIQARAQGNPFFIEELIDTLRETGRLEQRPDGIWALAEEIVAALRAAGCLVRDAEGNYWVLDPNASLANVNLGLPDSIHGIVLARLDRLPEMPKLTLKMASVIGRTFELDLLAAAHPLHLDAATLTIQIEEVASRDFVRLEAPVPQVVYLFKHNITQEVTYATLLFDQRRQLHRAVAEWYETTYGDGEALATYYPLLVYHWRQAEDPDRERHYAALAGERAAAQFANTEAVTYLSRALELTPDAQAEERYRLLLVREAVHDRRGARDAQAADLAALDHLVTTRDSRPARAIIALRQAQYAYVTGDYPAALAATRQAIDRAITAADAGTEAAATLIRGKVLWYQGNYEMARALFLDAGTVARNSGHRNEEAESLRWLGQFYLHRGNNATAETSMDLALEIPLAELLAAAAGSPGSAAGGDRPRDRSRDYQTAREYCEQALTIFQATGNRAGATQTLNNLGLISTTLGDLETARTYGEQALKIFREVGDRKNEGFALSNLGITYLESGDAPAALRAQQEVLEICREIDDRQGEGVSQVNLAQVYHALDENAAARHACEQALSIARAIGDRQSEIYALNYLGQACEGLHDLAAAAAAYQKTLQLRREAGQDALTMDTLAGLARVALAEGRAAPARDYVDEILAWITANGIEGVEEPLRVYLTCYDVLRATGTDAATTARAESVLTTMHGLLQERAARIGDPVRRRQYLDGIAAHRGIQAAWAARA